MRKTSWTRRVVALSLLGPILSAPSVEGGQQGKLTVAVAAASRRITRTEKIDASTKTIELYAARNELEPFQVVVRAEGGPVENINATISALVSGDGQSIPRKNLRLFREYFLFVIQPSGSIGWIPKIEYPGPMLPFRDPYSDKHEPYGAPFDNRRIGTASKPFRKKKTALGPANVFIDGHYTGKGDRRYVIQIDTGSDVGEGATFRWSDSWQEGLDRQAKVKRWNAEKVPIPEFDDDKKTEPVPLNDGVAVRFCAGKKKVNDIDFVPGHTFHFNTYEAMNEVIWGEIHVAEGTPPGIYTGKLTVTATGHEAIELPIKLTVWNFTIPKEKSIVTAFHGSLSSGFFAKAPQADWLYELMLHAHRMDTQRIHGGGLHINVKEVLAGRKGINWARFDQAAAGRLDGSAYPDGVPMKMFHLGYGVGNEWNFGFYAKGNAENVERYAKLEAEHLKEKGWFDRVYKYCHDEPYPEDMKAIARDIKAYLEADPDWRGKFMVTSSPNHYTSPMGPLIDIWCPKFHWWIKEPAWKYVREHKKTLWIYVANSPHSPIPTYHVDTIKGYEPRIIKWASWQLGAEGFLYWMMCLNGVHPNPWTTPMTAFGVCGDANFVYPGARNGRHVNDNATPLRPIMGPICGFRIKQIREGLEDWEYLILCEKAKGRDFTMKIAREVYRSPGGGYGEKKTPEQLDKAWTQDDQKIYQARAKLAAAILSAR